MAAILFSACVVILIAGWLWFYIARPMLEDFGIIRGEETVNGYQDSDAYVMSRSEGTTPPSSASSLETDARQTRDALETAKPKAEEYLTLCRLMRKAGINREDAQAAFKVCNLPFNNNVWRDAAPAASTDESEYRTPIVGRPTNAKFETDPDFPYQSPA